jgi:hypothetical protein
MPTYLTKPRLVKYLCPAGGVAAGSLRFKSVASIVLYNQHTFSCTQSKERSAGEHCHCSDKLMMRVTANAT